MNLFTIARTIGRNKIVAIPVGVLTLVALAYVFAVKPATYSASASVLLAGPPSPPTQAQIAANPKLAKINATNSFLSYGSLVDVADISMELLNSSASQQAMARGGVGPKYTAALSTAYGTPPIIDITGQGPTAAQAINNANIVAKQIAANLAQIQTRQGVNPYYMIKAENLVTPVSATRSTSGKLRSAIAYLAVGIILLMVLVSISEGLRRRRDGRDYSDGPAPSTDALRPSRDDAAQGHAQDDDQRRRQSDGQRRYPPLGVEARQPHGVQRNSYID